MARNLGTLGHRTIGVDSDFLTVMKAIAFEIPETFRRRDKIGMGTFLQRDLTGTTAGSLQKRDAIIVSALSEGWFTSQPELGMETLTTLMAKCDQLFVNLPPAIRDELSDRLRHGAGDLKLTFLDDEESAVRVARLRRKGFRDPDGRREIPRGLEAVETRSSILDVDLDRCRDLSGASFSGGLHPFAATLRQYAEDHELRYGTSILKLYYERFTPRSMQELLFGAAEDAMPPLDAGWPPLPWLRLPQASHRARPRFVTKRTEERGGNQHFGPNALDFGREELRRVTGAYDRLASQGYQPEIFPDGYIRGYLLKRGEDYRFYVTEGKHRCAALPLLGHKRARCRFDSQPIYPRVVDIEALEEWPLVKSGFYPRETAGRVFEALFGRNGLRVARETGLPRA